MLYLPHPPPLTQPVLIHTRSEHERAQSQVATLQGEKESLTSKVGELEGEVKKLRRDLDEETEKATAMTEVRPYSPSMYSVALVHLTGYAHCISAMAFLQCS